MSCVFKCTGARAEPSAKNEKKWIVQQILQIAQNDPDAFDADRIQAEGIKYICNPAGYSVKLDDLCAQYSKK
jgi:hypothetical protein